MSAKKETEKITTSSVAEDDNVTYRRSTSPPTYSKVTSQEQYHSINKAIDETKENIRRGVEEARQQIPRNTQAVNNYQEQSLRASEEITDSYLDSQKEIINSFQSIWAPYLESMYDTYRNNWASPRRSAELYTRFVSNFADNMLAATRIGNNAMISNMEAFRATIQRRKDDMKEFSRIGVNTARTFEKTSKEVVGESSNR
jgi:hypothetical protein